MRIFYYSNAFYCNECINTTVMDLHKLFKIMKRQVHECLIPPLLQEQGIISRPGRVSVNHGADS
jgi:hypothetical protein